MGTWQLRKVHRIPGPAVIVTDHCKELKSALSDAFPNTQQQICIFHVVKNVFLNAKKKWVKHTEPDSEDEEVFVDVDDAEEDEEEVDAEEARALARIRREMQEAEEPGVVFATPAPLPHDRNGVEALFRVMVYADTEDSFFQA